MHIPCVIQASAKLEISEPKINQKSIQKQGKHESIEITNGPELRTVQIERDEIALGQVSLPGFPRPVEGHAHKQHLSTSTNQNHAEMRLCCVWRMAVWMASLLVLWEGYCA